MSFSIKQIKAILSEHNMPVDDLDKAAEEICGRHSADMDSIKEERDGYKKDAETLAAVQKELDDLKAQPSDGFKEKYEKEHKAFEDYKADIAKKETRASKEAAYKEVLKDAGVAEKHWEKILKYSDVDGVELDEKGKIKMAADLLKSIKEEWADHIESPGQKGAATSTPPTSTGGNENKPNAAALRAQQYYAAHYGAAPVQSGANN